MSIAFVTGGTGFIGSHTVEHLLSQGIRVRALVRPNRKRVDWISELPVEFVTGDLLQPSSIEPALRDVDYIIHIAGVTKAKRRREYFEGNLSTTRSLLELATKIPNLKKFVYLSSLTVVGPSVDGSPASEATECHPITAYGTSKLEAEKACRAYLPSLPLVILRPPTVYGPRDRDVLELFRTTKFGIQPSVGSSHKTLSLIYGPDLAQAVVRSALSAATSGKTYFVSDPVVYRQQDLFDMLKRLVGRRSVRMRLPVPLVYATAAVVEGISFFGPKPAVLSMDKARDLVQDHWTCTPDRIKQDIGFVAETPADRGLQTTYQWYKERHWL